MWFSERISLSRTVDGKKFVAMEIDGDRGWRKLGVVGSCKGLTCENRSGLTGHHWLAVEHFSWLSSSSEPQTALQASSWYCSWMSFNS